MMRKRTTGIDVLAIGRASQSKDETSRNTVKRGAHCASCLAICTQVIAILVISFFMSVAYLLVKYSGVSVKLTTASIRSPKNKLKSSTSSETSNMKTNGAPECTSEQLDKIRKQLNPSHPNCLEGQYNQQCPITVATKCFRDSWLINYYSRTDISIDSFLAVTVGCDGGYRSVELLRMGTKDSSVDVASWTNALKDANSGTILATTCADVPSGTRQAALLPGSSPVRKGFVYCVEERPDTVDAIGVANVNNIANYATKGLVVHHSRIAGMPETIYHPKAGSKGPCDTDAQRAENCVSVPVEKLDDFADARIGKTGNINVLEISNGYEFDALIGGINTLKRTEYVLFKFDWKDQWQGRGRNAASVSTILDKLGFTCYWAGMEKLWRITACPFSQYLTHKFWANIACANRNLVPTLLDEMEKLFLNTIKE
jgi:hypothetical protein